MKKDNIGIAEEKIIPNEVLRGLLMETAQPADSKEVSYAHRKSSDLCPIAFIL